MKCDFYVTEEIHGSGRKICRCRLCPNKALLPRSGIASDISATCVSGTESFGGPGTELMKLLKQLGISPDKCNHECYEMAKRMDEWGPAGCREHKAEIIAHLHKAYSKLSWSDIAAFTRRAVESGLAFRIGLADPAEWLVDESIRRAEQHP